MRDSWMAEMTHPATLSPTHFKRQREHKPDNDTGHSQTTKAWVVCVRAPLSQRMEDEVYLKKQPPEAPSSPALPQN